MRALKLAAGVGAGLAVLSIAGKALASSTSSRRDATSPGLTIERGGLYVPDEARPYGPYHGSRRPAGLPSVVARAHGSAGDLRIDGLLSTETARLANQTYQSRFKVAPARVDIYRVRLASKPGAAVPYAQKVAAEHQLGDTFVRTMANLVQREGEGGTWAAPARNFNVPCQTKAVDGARRCTVIDAPRTGTLITAWGAFQWNRDAGRDLHTLDDLGLTAPSIPRDWMPWDWSPHDEIAIPVEYYAQLFALVKRRGGNDRDAARGVRLWHTGPSRFRRYIAAGASDRAWSQVDATIANRIDRHLADAGVA